MRLSSISSLAIMLLVAFGALGIVLAPHGMAQTPTSSAEAVLRTAAGDEVGRATFSAENGAVVVDLSASGLQPGFHGFHVHGAGQCDGPDFTSAGGHFNPMNMAHGMVAGDLPSLLVNQDGTGVLRATTDRFSIDDLLAGNGTSVIVHAGPDNFGNIPTRYAPAPDATTLATGDAGARIACGVITPATM